MPKEMKMHYYLAGDTLTFCMGQLVAHIPGRVTNDPIKVTCPNCQRRLQVEIADIQAFLREALAHRGTHSPCP